MTASDLPSKFAPLLGPCGQRQWLVLGDIHSEKSIISAELANAFAAKCYPPLPPEDQRFPGGHPEQYADEVLLSNYEDASWTLSNYATKRAGRQAFDKSGRLVPGAFPVFVKRDEVEERGWSVTTDGRLSTSPTGRLSRSEPEIQHFPGTPQARAQSRKLQAARAAAGDRLLIDFSELERRIPGNDLDPPPAAE